MAEHSDHRSVADCLCELGHPTRLQIYRSLVQASPNGLAVQEIQQRLDVPASTLSHHISRLVGVNLLEQVREGRVLRCYAVTESLQSVLDYLAAECCCASGCAERPTSGQAVEAKEQRS